MKYSYGYSTQNVLNNYWIMVINLRKKLIIAFVNQIFFQKKMGDCGLELLINMKFQVNFNLLGSIKTIFQEI